MRGHVAAGRDALTLAASALDRLHDATDASVLVRRRWLSCWVDAYPEWEPFVVATGDASGWQAVAPLARRKVAGTWKVVAIGDPDPVRCPVVSTDPAATFALVDVLRSELDRTRRPWSVHIPAIDDTDPLVKAMCEAFPVRATSGRDVRPQLDIDERDPRTYLTRNTRSSVARHRNRARRLGLELTTTWTRDPAEVRRRLPTMLAVHRQRDLQLRGRSALDVAAVRRQYHAIVDRHPDRLELCTLDVDGDLAAYGLCVRDDPVLYVFDNRMNPAYAGLAPGLIVNAETVVHAVEDDAIVTLDWGLGQQRYKLSNANHCDGATTITAWSSRLAREASGARARVRDLVAGYRPEASTAR